MVQKKKRFTRRHLLKFFTLGFAGALDAGCNRRGMLGTDRKPAPTEVKPTSVVQSTKIPATPKSKATQTPPTADAPNSHADVLFVNGKVITMDGAGSVTKALAISGNHILEAGSDDALRRLVTPQTKTIDLKGRVMTPGLIDTHFHYLVYGMQNGYYANFMPPAISNKQDLLDALKGAVAKAKPGDWVSVYFMFSDLPTRYDLDIVSGENPVWIFYLAGHIGVANSVALKIAGIDAQTPDIQGGIIERGANHEPTGVFYNHCAMDLVRREMPPYTVEMAQKDFSPTQQVMASYGITSFHDNNVRDLKVLTAYHDYASAGKNIVRGNTYATLEYETDIQNVLKVPHYEGDYARFAGFKFLIDGQLPMAYCHAKHNGVAWDMPTWDPKVFKRSVRAMHDTGLQICVHCIGDAAVDLTLDAYEEAMNANPRPDPRHRIEHCVLSTAGATKRMKDLGVCLGVQPHFLYWVGPQYVSYFGEQRAKRVIVTREWLDAGVPVAISSDAPTMPLYTPQITIAGAVFRMTTERKVNLPDQVMTPLEALRAHTLTAAYVGHEEANKGSLEPGKLADIVVWAEDPLSLSFQQMIGAKIDLTIVDGQTVYQRV